jgi:toxin YoeB
VRSVHFHARAFEQFTGWAAADSKLYQRIAKLIQEAAREPFTGTGKPEPLRHQFKGYWSRRITEEHRLVYRVTPEEIFIASCRDHY